MNAKRLPNGNLRIPMRAESEDGRLEGDGFLEIDPTHPDYAEWERAIQRREEILSSIRDTRQPSLNSSTNST